MVFKVITWAFGGVTQFSRGSFITGGGMGGGGSTENLEGCFSSPTSSLKARADLVTY